MRVLTRGKPITTLRFTPDSQRLLIGWWTREEGYHLELCSLQGECRTHVVLPTCTDRYYPTSLPRFPVGESVQVAWDGWMHCYRIDGDDLLPWPNPIFAQQLVVSADGSRLGLTRLIHETRTVLFQVRGVTADAGGHPIGWDQTLDAPFALVGFLPDGERLVTIDSSAVRIRAFAGGEELGNARYPTYNVNHPQLSPNGRYLGVVGYQSMYLYDIAALGKPRMITSTRSFGDFRSFAFHPDGRMLAVIHGGPTLVKLYDVETLKLRAKYNWKVGALSCVTFSPDGMLGAAGSEDGRIVLWDVDD